jgi:hypothetical protein
MQLKAIPWRYSVADYMAATGTQELVGAPFEVAWAPGLSVAMEKRQKLIHEEAMADLLLADLATRPASSCLR